jgi:hypothetical protein
MIQAFENWLTTTPTSLLLGIIALVIGALLVQIFIDEFL